jgi:peptidoglycan/LPS O-acetylase OafA/YrhL
LKQRIQTLDGLRFLAAMGVLWIHNWMAFNTPRCYVGRIDIADFFALGANGVDLFFVISGFCMYYFYGTKADFSYQSFARFIKKRWVRLSPAFYAATIVYIIVDKYIYHQEVSVVFDFLHSLFYLNYVEGQYNTARHFWTLTVEWQFYFIIPFLLIYQNKIGFKKSFVVIFASVCLMAVTAILYLNDRSDFLTYTLLFHVAQFGCGVLAARLLLKSTIQLKYRALWLFAFILIAYCGRVMISAKALSLSVHYYNLFKIAGYALMGLCFAGILYMAVTSVKWLNIVLGNRVFKTMGRISYSFYLFHVLIFPPIVILIQKHFPEFINIGAPIVTTLISAVILYPVSLLSFHFLEKPFLSVGNLSTK